MPYGKITCLFVIFQVIFTKSRAGIQSKVISPRLVNFKHIFDGETSNNSTLIQGEFKNNSVTLKFPFSRPNGKNQVRFIDLNANDSMKEDEMEAPAPKFSFLNLLTGNENDEEDDDDHDLEKADYDSQEKTKEENEEDDGTDFFGEEEDETNLDKLKDENEEDLLKQYHRHGLRMHSLVFPLLMAYKLKFFTVIPLLLGSLVLLVGTTAIAGFFFALFAAALGIHVKSQGQNY